MNENENYDWSAAERLLGDDPGIAAALEEHGAACADEEHCVGCRFLQTVDFLDWADFNTDADDLLLTVAGESLAGDLELQAKIAASIRFLSTMSRSLTSFMQHTMLHDEHEHDDDEDGETP